MFQFIATLRRALTVIVTSASLLFVAAVPASAESSCDDNHVCMWEDNNFGGDRWVNQEIKGDGAWDIDWWHGDNEISSIKNTSDKWLCVYPGDYTWGGGEIMIAPNTQYANLALSFGFDNEAESFKVTSDTNTCT